MTNSLCGCHPSCAECTGLNENNCLSCSNPNYYLQNGVCVFACDAKYYSNSLSNP
jgi:proprotein convertase subtilisin/kexin type 5